MNQSLVIKRIGFVSTRISGTDGVSLEIGKWSRILERMGYEVFYICGRSDRPAERSFVIEEADFLHPEIVEIDEKSFDRRLKKHLNRPAWLVSQESLWQGTSGLKKECAGWLS